MATLLEKGDFADFEIRCRGETFPVHKAIISSQSTYLRAAIGRDFRVSARAFRRAQRISLTMSRKVKKDSYNSTKKSLKPFVGF